MTSTEPARLPAGRRVRTRQRRAVAAALAELRRLPQRAGDPRPAAAQRRERRPDHRLPDAAGARRRRRGRHAAHRGRRGGLPALLSDATTTTWSAASAAATVEVEGPAVERWADGGRRPSTASSTSATRWRSSAPARTAESTPSALSRVGRACMRGTTVDRGRPASAPCSSRTPPDWSGWPPCSATTTPRTSSRSPSASCTPPAAGCSADDAKVVAYLNRIVVNEVRSRHRRRQVARRDAHLLTTVDGAGRPHRRARRSPGRASRRWPGLPQRQREALVLRFWMDLPLAAIAEAMGVRIGTVKSQISRGLDVVGAALREEVER